MESDKYYMGIALKEAELAAREGEVPVGAVLIDEEGNILAQGHNLRENLQDVTAHAEIVALRSANKFLQNWRLEGCTLYVTLEPCPMCAGAIVMARLKRLVYGKPDAKAGAVESLFNITQHHALNHQVQVTANVLEEKCAEVLRTFFLKKR